MQQCIAAFSLLELYPRQLVNLLTRQLFSCLSTSTFVIQHSIFDILLFIFKVQQSPHENIDRFDPGGFPRISFQPIYFNQI